MTIKKQPLKSKPEIKITFEVEKKDAQGAVNINLLSEHNQWQAIAFKQLKSGKFKLAINLPTKSASSFQYIFQATNTDNQQIMLLPTDADGYVDNGMNDGGKNALLKIS
ncbi:1,4-alpha-glucan-branching protein [Psychromonas hadalis]|uniref:1,4-alpha-glucan-branching protein n=1 Tax=Psychromonas hadalis TaxID=211669 RepID=UPI0003B7886C|nr:1,4-alpha-glucan-branching protein [Psychromonas hadalis]